MALNSSQRKNMSKQSWSEIIETFTWNYDTFQVRNYQKNINGEKAKENTSATTILQLKRLKPLNLTYNLLKLDAFINKNFKPKFGTQYSLKSTGLC